MFRPLKGGKENADFDLKIINSDIKAAKISLVLLILFLAMFILMTVGGIIVSAH